MATIWRSIQGRLLVIFFLTLLPVYIIGMYIHSWGLSTMRRSVEDHSLSQLEVYRSSFESDIQRLVTLQIDLLNSNEVAWLANMNSVMSDYERGKAINDLQKRLQYLSSASIYSIGVDAHIPSLGMTVSSVEGARAFNDENRLLMQAQTPHAELPLLVYSGNLYTSVSFRLSDSKALYNVTARLSREQIRRELEQLKSSDGIAFAFFGGEGGVTIDAGGLNGADLREVEKMVLPMLAETSRNSGLADIALQGQEYLALYARCNKIDLIICNLIRKQVLYEPAAQFMRMLWFFLISGIIVLLLFAIYVRNSIHRPLQLLIGAFREMERNNLNATIDYKRSDEYGYLFEQFNHMLGTLGDFLEQSYKQTIMLRSAELKQLQAQINPHFLYNSYFLLHRMIQRADNERAALFSSYLGQYMKYITRNAESETSLRQEAGHARTFAVIQAMRFEGRIEVDFAELPEGFQERRVPRLILQPLLENAFEHGLRNKRTGGLLRVRFAAEGDTLQTMVEDNGDEVSDADIIELTERQTQQQIERTGLLNIHHRLRLRHSEKSGLRFFRSELGGLCVKLTIEFKEQNQADHCVKGQKNNEDDTFVDC